MKRQFKGRRFYAQVTAEGAKVGERPVQRRDASVLNRQATADGAQGVETGRDR